MTTVIKVRAASFVSGLGKARGGVSVGGVLRIEDILRTAAAWAMATSPYALRTNLWYELRDTRYVRTQWYS